MKNFSSAYAAHLQESVTTLAICWRIVKKNGTLILGTNHDRDIVITQTSIGVEVSPSTFDLGGRYRASSGIAGSDIKSSADMSVDNLEVRGVVSPQPDMFIDISVADIEAGQLDSATVTTFRLNWQEPDDFQEVMRHGSLGEISRTSEGEYRTEVRGLAQLLQQTIGRTCGERCDVKEFGDERCKLDVAARSVTGVVTAVSSNRRFDTTLDVDTSTEESPYFRLGKLTWLTGDNTDYAGQVKLDNVGAVLGNLELFESFPNDVQVGDTFILAPGCDRRYVTCRDVHDNLINFRGFPFVPGMDQIIRAP